MKTDSEILNEVFNAIPHGQYYLLRDIIIKRCGTTRHVLGFWRYGKTPIPLLAKKEIEKIAAELDGVEEKHLFPELHKNE